MAGRIIRNGTWFTQKARRLPTRKAEVPADKVRHGEEAPPTWLIDSTALEPSRYTVDADTPTINSINSAALPDSFTLKTPMCIEPERNTRLYRLQSEAISMVPAH